MIILGQWKKNITSTQLNELYIESSKRTVDFNSVSIHKIIEVLDRVGKLWCSTNHYYQDALDKMAIEVSFHPDMNKLTMDIIPELLNIESLKSRVISELGSLELLENYSQTKEFKGKVRAFSRGVLTHISAGNVFLGCIDSLLMGFLTKNINIVKLSSNNQVFPELFSKSILEADTENILTPYFSIVHWKGGDASYEDIVKNQSDTIMAWGGKEMVESYKDGLSLNCRLLDFGPKISLQIITKDGEAHNSIDQIAKSIAKEIIIWDQSACASPQNLFFQDGIDYKRLIDAVALELDKAIPRGRLEQDEYVEILKEKALGLYDFVDGGYENSGRDYYLRYDPNPELRPSPLNRTLIFKKFKSITELTSMLNKFKYFMQSASILASYKEEKTLLEMLPLRGIKRIAPLGKLMDGMTGAPHDGHYILSELVNYIPWEAQEDLLHFLNDVVPKTPYYRNLAPEIIQSINQMPITSSDTYKKHAIHRGNDLLNEYADHGHIFSSGGTSGEAKFTFYTHDEFKTTGEMLSIGIKAQGLKPQTKVANLFAAGNMWSSFMAIDIALRECEAIQLPIGGLCPIADIINYLKVFNVKVVFGLPSMLVEYAQYSEKNNIKLSIDTIYFAGEHFHVHAKEYLKKVWAVKNFCSAGYASVDAGLLGYQTPDCAYGEHYLLSKYVLMEIIDNEAVVTSRFRRAMPIIRYRTGDEIEWIMAPDQTDGDPKFRLKGRIDGQLNIWACKVNQREIAHSIDSLASELLNYQVDIDQDSHGQDRLTFDFEEISNKISIKQLAMALKYHCHDINQTLELKFIESHIAINHLSPGGIKRIERTGKIKTFQDKR
jgi:phenylacetate-CoA ligase